MIDVYRTTPADLRRIALEKGRMGYVAGSDRTGTGQIHHTNAAVRGGRYNQKARGETAQAEARLIAQLESGLPIVRRRTDQERFRALFNRLAETALASYRRVGRVEWPTSIQRELQELAWKTGDPKLNDFGGLDHVYKQVEALTRHYTVKGANQQKEKDDKKTALDWHGHYAA